LIWAQANWAFPGPRTLKQYLSPKSKARCQIKIFRPRCLCFHLVSLYSIRKWVRNSMHGDWREISIFPHLRIPPRKIMTSMSLPVIGKCITQRPRLKSCEKLRTISALLHCDSPRHFPRLFRRHWDQRRPRLPPLYPVLSTFGRKRPRHRRTPSPAGREEP
jgi:hypothetical protein